MVHGVVKDVRAAYAIVRVDLRAADDEQRFTVRRIVWSESLAESEVERLQALNGDKSCSYFWQHTRVEQEPARADAEHIGTVTDDDQRALAALDDAIETVAQRHTRRPPG